MTHLAMLQTDDEGNSATWGAHVTDEEYGGSRLLDQDERRHAHDRMDER